MKKTRLKLPAIVIRSREEMENLAGQIAELKNRQKTCCAEMDAGLTAIRERFAVVLGGLEDELAAKMEMARQWAENNPAEFSDSKSLDLTHAAVGYRTGQPQLKPVPGSTWDRVLETLKITPWAGSFIRTRHEVNKQQVLAQRRDLGPERLRELGLRVTQEETFYVEPKSTQTETRQSIPVAA